MMSKVWVLLVLFFLAGRVSAEEGVVTNEASAPAQSTETNASNTHTLSCPKCHCEMEEGVIL